MQDRDLIVILFTLIFQTVGVIYKLFYSCDHEYVYKGKTKIGDWRVLHTRECKKCGRKNQTIEYY